jgi:hypothetical protein
MLERTSNAALLNYQYYSRETHLDNPIMNYWNIKRDKYFNVTREKRNYFYFFSMLFNLFGMIFPDGIFGGKYLIFKLENLNTIIRN